MEKLEKTSRYYVEIKKKVSEDDADVFESGEALGHNYGAWQQHNAAQHIRVCGRCGNEELQDHENGSDRICDVCSYESACIHEWDEPPSLLSLMISKNSF